MSSKKKSVNLLPEYLKSDKNSKFLSATIDQFIQSPELERIDGYIGSKITPNYNSTTDFYIKENLPLRKNYALEPAMVFKDKTSKINDVISYDDLINELQTSGSSVENLDRIFRTKFYSYDPLIDWDKLVNYNQYYWLPMGPEPVLLDQQIDVESEILGNPNYITDKINSKTGEFYSLTNGLKVSFNNAIQSEYNSKIFIVEGVGDSIRLIDFNLLDGYEGLSKVLDETFDSRAFDEFPFDADRRLPLDPEYLTINRASRDLNPWSRYNRWFHIDVINMVADIIGTVPVIPLEQRAKRPIIEFKPNIQLYKFGKKGIRNVDLIDDTPSDALNVVHGSYGYYIDGVLLQSGHRIIFNADKDLNVKGKIYQVSFTTGTTPILQLTEVEEPDDLDSIAVNFGKKYTGTSWFYNKQQGFWEFSQQHNKLNQPPLFDLYNNQGESYSTISPRNSFSGNKIFSYDIGTGINDEVLGFPLKYQNSVGVGSYLFKNYFMTDEIILIENNVSNIIPTSITLLKIYDIDGNEKLINVWKESIEYQIPIIEVQTIESTTSSLVLTCLDFPIDTSLSVSAYVDDIKLSTTINATSKSVIVNFDQPVETGKNILFKILTSDKPNKNGYYETPLSLTNNPLNGPISDMTLSELSAHVYSMTSRMPEYNGYNLRDLSDYSKYGTRLIISSNPISFAQIFFGKKEHNVVDSIRLAGYHYNQFKSVFLRKLLNLDGQLIPSKSLDIILKEINLVKDDRSVGYRSDMLGYGDNKTVRSFVISDKDDIEYPVGFDFDLSKISYQSVLVYLNDNQLVVDKDYYFDYFNGSVVLKAQISEGDKLEIHVYSSTLGCYVPATPSKLGLYPCFVPEIYEDNSYANGPILMIRGHDGSVMRAYEDYRDDIILELEKRIYNNIKVRYDSKIFDINSALPGAFRSNKFNLQETNDIIVEDFIRWSGLNNIDTLTNSTFDEGNPFTWNFKNTQDLLLGLPTTGTWRSLYRYYFDTERPHTHPWEMIGYTNKPDWWDNYYSWTESEKRLSLINAIENGLVDEPPSTKTNLNYARPGISNFIPVDINGELLPPNEFLVGDNSYQDKKSNWMFGDMSPVETAWRRSSYWPFVINIFAALSNPCTYTSRLYDVSRTSINSLEQVNYLEDDLYLDPRKIIIDGENNQQIAGYGVFVLERGKQKDVDYPKKLRQDIDYLDINLFHKLGGFTSKEKLQISIDSIDPISRSPGVVLPPEDYSLILNVSNPIKSARISGIIVQKSNGKFIVKGYDVAKPYFEILKPVKSLTSGVVTVGGVSEKFTDWMSIVQNNNPGLTPIETTTAVTNSSRYYKQGQIVRYNNSFYRVKISHVAQSTFDSTLFVKLDQLPIKGGATAQLPSSYEKSVTRIPYGTEFFTIQEVYDFIVGYGAYLESQGFIFDERQGDLGEILNWKFTGKEFLYWTTQNWADGSVIALSPFANKIKYGYTDSVVDNVNSNKYEYSLLKADGKPFPIENFRLTRDDGICTIDTLNTEEGLFFAVLNSIQKEHALVFNNSTVFNDTIYDLESGYKQRRMKLFGFRTKGWNGDLFSPGFVYDSVEVVDWNPYTSYIPGDVVRYNGSYYESLARILNDEKFDFSKWVKLREKPEPDLLPNFDYKITQFEDFYSLDVDNFDIGQQELAQHLIGYTPRTYLNNLFTNLTSQYKFYQGFIKEKGTRNAIDKISKVGQRVDKGSIEISEEWAFRVGHYGSFETYSEIEFKLEEGTSLENPYLVDFVDSVPAIIDPLTNYVTPDSLLLKGVDYISSQTFITSPGTFVENNIELLTAGYVSLDDVTATAYGKSSLLDIANNSFIQQGNTFWVGFLENGSWTVYRYARKQAKIAGVFVSSPGQDITFVTDVHHNLKVGDIVSIVNFNDQVNGIYVVSSIPNLSQFVVPSELTTIVNEELLSYGALFKFDDVRYENFEKVAETPELLYFETGEKFWVDQGLGGKWQVYEKIKNYRTFYLDSSDFVTKQQLGRSVYASDNTPIMMVSAPNWFSTGTNNIGRIKVFNDVNGKLVKDFEYDLNNTGKVYASSTSTAEFGYSLNYDIEKELYFAGAPAASNVAYSGSTGTVILSLGIETPSSYTSQGLVKISSNNKRYAEEKTEAVLVSPYPATDERFGNTVYVDQVSSSTSTLLIVGAPGTGDIRGNVYIYNLSKSNSVLTITTSSSGISLEPNGTLPIGMGWGHKVVGSSNGVAIAISAPNYLNNSNKGLVQIFTKIGGSANHVQTIEYPLDSPNAKFGHDIAISDSGYYLVITAPEHKEPNKPYGKVFVYKFNEFLTRYELVQTLSNPVKYNDIKFGYSVSIDKNEQTIVIGSLGVNRSRIRKFDVDSQTGETTFDNGITRFIDPIPDSGEVYIYDKVGDYFIPADELSNGRVRPDSNFGISLVATNDKIFVGAPNLSGSLVISGSNLFIFERIDKTSDSWKIKNQQEDLVDVSKIGRVALIDSSKDEVAEYLDIIDPLKGKIAGIAEQELRFKSAFDPAIYSFGVPSTVNDTTSNWLDEHVGDLWWDLSTAKYIWYEQGSDIFRKNNWGRLFPGATIDVYEWVKSDILPSEWAAQADTNDGLTNGISGQPKHPDNSVISVKQVYNNVTNSFENVYYFWVKNKVTVPNVQNRRISGFQVASIIADPVSNGLKFVEILSSNSLAIANVQPMLSGSKINLNISIDPQTSGIPRHTEWMLMNEGDYRSLPNTVLEKKFIDSLLGQDSVGNVVPDPTLSDRAKYGISFRPRQSMFKNRSEALRNLIVFANSVLLKNRIRDNYSFEYLNSKEEIPSVYDREYDFIVEESSALDDINTVFYKKAEATCNLLNGKIYSVTVTEPGAGYITAPGVQVIKIVRDSVTNQVISKEIDNESILEAEIDSAGKVSNISVFRTSSGLKEVELVIRPHAAIVEVDDNYKNRWSKYYFDYNLKTWTRVQTQSYNTTLYWDYVDWKSDTYNEFKPLKEIIDNVFDLNSLIDVKENDYVKIKNNGSGRYVILEKVSDNQLGNFLPSYNIVFSESGTIQLSDSLWDFENTNYSYDATTLEETLYDQSPDLELYYILKALKENIFVGDLKVNWNLFFFAGVKYALTEQKLLDWAFKTSFINVVNRIGSLDQRPVYKLDNEKYFENYIREVKPYRTNIRNYTSAYGSIDLYDGQITDFDLPTYFNTSTGIREIIQINSLTPKSEFTITNTLTNVYPWKDWTDNYTYEVESIQVADGGSRYTEIPTVIIETAPGDYGYGATAQAYIRSGSIYKIVVTNPGKGYIIPPIVKITGGGNYVTSPAKVSVVMSNNKIRKNTIGIKFDRISKGIEISEYDVVDTFVCSGNQNSFVLSWLADTDKLTIVPTLDSRMILSTDYTIEYYTEPYAGYNKRYSRFVFLNEVPVKGQVFTVRYKKNIDLYNAIDRIERYYSPSDGMPGKDYSLLMTGLEYPQTQLKGLKFEETPPWNTTGYDLAPWGDLVTSYAEVKIVADANISDTILFVNTTTGILPGQSISAITTGSTVYFRDDTVVESVDHENRAVTISSPVYKLKKVKAKSTEAGSLIEFTTLENFNGNLRVNDIIQVSEVSPVEFNGQYQIFTCTNNKFWAESNGILSSTTGTVTSSSSIRIYSILTTIPAISSIELDRVVETTTGTSTVVIETYALMDEVVNVDGTVSTGEPVWDIVASNDNPPKVNVVVTDLTTTTETTIDIKLYGRTTLEFWKNNTEFRSLDSSIGGGTWQGDSLSGALGVKPEDIVIDGDKFINPNSSHAPEEFVPGFVVDSLGINVYTQPEITSPMIMTIAVPIIAGQVTRYPLPAVPENPVGVFVYYNGTTFQRVDDINSNVGNYFSIQNNEILISPQIISGRAFCTLVFVGVNTPVDSGVTFVDKQDSNVTYGTVTSLFNYNDVKSVYVTLNGKEISEYTGTAPGYILGPYNSKNHRAAVKVILPEEFNKYNIEVWFFKDSYPKFNRMYQEVFEVGETTQSVFVLNLPPDFSDPASAQGIVEIGTPYDLRRLRPPLMSYYKVSGSEVTFDIDNKKEQSGVHNLGNVKVYLNGVELRPGFDWLVDSENDTVTIINGLLTPGDTVAVMSLIDYDYIINNGVLYLTNSIGPNQIVRLTSFTDHDNLYIKTERFKVNSANEYTLSLPVISERYIWVSAGSQYLNSGYEFTLLSDMRTVSINDLVQIDPEQEIIITTLTPPRAQVGVIGYRIFKDIFENQTFKRLSKYYTAELEKPLSYLDTEIYIKNGNTLFHPNPAKNLPGVIIIDAERIEYFTKNGNILTDLRRSTLGTGPAFYSQSGTKVIDQSVKQALESREKIIYQHLYTNTNTVIISDSGENGILLTTPCNINTISSVENDIYVTLSLKDNWYKNGDTVILNNVEPVFYNGVYNIERIMSNEIEVINASRNLNDPSIITLTTFVPHGLISGDAIETLTEDPLASGKFLILDTPDQFTLRYQAKNQLDQNDLDTSTRAVSLIEKVTLKVIDSGGRIHVKSLSTLTTGVITGTVTTSSFAQVSYHNPVDQVEVYYGGRKLRKSSIVVHDNTISYDTSTQSLRTLDPEFSINTSTQELTLNINEEINTSTRITVVQRKGEIWTTSSLITSLVPQAVFLRNRPAEFPDSYYYGGESIVTDENNNPLFDDSGILEGF